MRVAVTKFPGSNGDQDALYSLREDIGVKAEYVWHDDESLDGFDAVFVPGGFSYGDYLRCGAIAARSHIVDAVKRFADDGRLVIGVCNGFQILCESGLLPGILVQNEDEHFICQTVSLEAVNRTSPWTTGVSGTIHIPIAHGEGKYVCDDVTLARLESENRIAFRYVSPEGNPNGSVGDIAGILNERGNVLGMMPHPERATKAILGSTDGLQILRAFTAVSV